MTGFEAHDGDWYPVAAEPIPSAMPEDLSDEVLRMISRYSTLPRARMEADRELVRRREAS